MNTCVRVNPLATVAVQLLVLLHNAHAGEPAAAPERMEATGYGSSRPLPDFAPGDLQQRRVEIIRLPAHSTGRSSR